MAINKMKFKDFVWPNNPRNCNISYNKRIISHSYPEIDGSEHEDLGTEPRTITGSGIFFGKGAYDQFKRLQKFQQQRTAGKLIHPIWGTINCRFTKLTSQEEPLPNYVEYTFEFIEEGIGIKITNNNKASSSSSKSSTTSNAKKYHTVVQGDTLGKISSKYYGTANNWRKIADANKNLIKDPNVIKIGWKLLIP